MEQKRPADIIQELLDYLWNGLGLEEKGWKRLKKGDFKKDALLWQAVQAGTNLQFLNPISKNQIQNACWAVPKPLVFCIRWMQAAHF